MTRETLEKRLRESQLFTETEIDGVLNNLTFYFGLTQRQKDFIDSVYAEYDGDLL